MISLTGGTFAMGSDQFYPEEGPVRTAEVAPFQIGRYAVTNAEFEAFVAATRYVTLAEQPFGGAPPASLVFRPTDAPVDLRDWRQWWRLQEGANWRHPLGPSSDIAGLTDHPVVQIAYVDAQAYCDWSGGRLPTEVEWEYAARGGLVGATYSWGNDANDGTRANTWQGRFPYRNNRDATSPLTSPVGSYPPNGFGLYEMTGNTWEWTSTLWTEAHSGDHCASPDPAERQIDAVKSHVLKGGSHLCAPEYCHRYRPAARSAQSDLSTASHIGFRIARGGFENEGS